MTYRARTDGITEEAIAILVDRFYDKVRTDPTLAPIFNAVVEDWAAHKRLLTAFWTTVALGTRSYRGNPLGKHRPLSIDKGHFDRWLELWHETTNEVLPKAAAEAMGEYAERIGVGLRVGLGLGARPRGRQSGIPVLSEQR